MGWEVMMDSGVGWEQRGLWEAGASGQRKEFDGRGLETGVIVMSTGWEWSGLSSEAEVSGPAGVPRLLAGARLLVGEGFFGGDEVEQGGATP